ncbi:MAG: hypothetical protein ACHQYQ_07000 [Bacteriovoracales bacterium]
MKIKNIFMALSLVFSLQAFSAKVPSSWLTSSGDVMEKSSEDMSDLEKTYDNILETKGDLIEEVAKGREHSKSKWYLQSIATSLGIEQKGSIGVLGLEGETAVSLIWQRTPESVKKLQQKYYGTSSAVAEKSIEDEIDPNGETLKITSETSKVEIAKQIEPIVEATFKAGKVKNKETLRKNLLKKVYDYQKMLADVDSAPVFTPWWVYKFQFELDITAEGEVLPFMVVGTEVRVKLEWYRIQKKTQDKSDKPISKNAAFLMSMAKDFETMDELAVGRNNDRHFALDTIKVGIGMVAEGEIGVAEVKGKVTGSVFFKREQVGDKMAQELPRLPDTFPIIGKGSIDKSVIGDNIRGALYNASRDRFRKGLKKAVKMAKFWSKGALKRHDRRIAQGKETNFDLNVIELELEITLGGGVGVVTLEGFAELELFLVKK